MEEDRSSCVLQGFCIIFDYSIIEIKIWIKRAGKSDLPALSYEIKCSIRFFLIISPIILKESHKFY